MPLSRTRKRLRRWRDPTRPRHVDEESWVARYFPTYFVQPSTWMAFGTCVAWAAVIAIAGVTRFRTIPVWYTILFFAFAVNHMVLAVRHWNALQAQRQRRQRRKGKD
jgi:hypothetical protein